MARVSRIERGRWPARHYLVYAETATGLIDCPSRQPRRSKGPEANKDCDDGSGYDERKENDPRKFPTRHVCSTHASNLPT